MEKQNGNPLQCSCMKNPRDREPGGLPSMGSHRVGHDWSDLAATMKITAEGDCSHEIKRNLLFRRKAMTNLDSILTSRVITFSAEVRIVKAMVFSSCHVWMQELKAKCWRTDAFELWCWRFLRIPWTASRSNQSILRKSTLNIYLLEGLMMKLKLQFLGPWREGQ